MLRSRGSLDSSLAPAISSLRDSGRSVASGEVPEPEPLTFLENLINGAGSDPYQRAQVAQYVMGRGEFTDEKCYRMAQTIKFQEEFIEKIKEAASRYSLRHGRAIPKGFVVTIIPLEYKELSDKQYLTWFFKNDPVPFNHNGNTVLVTKDPRGNDVDDITQTLAEFADYLTVGTTPPQISDGLEYFEDKDGATYHKYNMPDILFTVVAGVITISPSTIQERFQLNKQVINGNNGGLPYPGSPDVANLETIRDNFKVGRMTPASDEMAALNQRFTFPNFLSGDMLLLKKIERERIPDSTTLGRPFPSETGWGAELWAKFYGPVHQYFVPYDDTIYIFPPSIKLMVRADDMVMYYDESDGQLSFSLPIGSYYIKPVGTTLIPNIFRDSVRHADITREVQEQVTAINNSLGGRGGLTPAMMMTPGYQKRLKAFSYIQNLTYIRETAAVPAGGKKTSKTSKPTKRRNIKYMAKSKKKYHK